MADDAEGPVYYVISDLHVGGDEQLEEVEFLDELLGFLRDLEKTDEDAELIVNGDAFGLWEITEVEGPAKFDALEEHYPELFEQLRRTGESVPITMLPGNHDHELAAYDEYVERLAAYNVDLVQDRSITRDVGDQAIYFEHGNQHDPNNHIQDWGNPYATPLGYFYNTHVTSRAGKLSDRGRYNWLKDVQAVTPTERLPNWLVSKYFYREMNPAIRYAIVPFLLLFNVSAILAVFAGLDLLGIWSQPIDVLVDGLGVLGRASRPVYVLATINVAVAGLLLLIGVPLYVLLRDVRQTLDRFEIFETELTVDPAEPYEDHAREVFGERPETTVYCYGHTHRPGVREVDGGLLVNSGTWLKRLHRRDVAGRLLPPVFYPTFELCAVRIAPDPDGVRIEYVDVEKPSPAEEELTYTERLIALGREPDPELPGPRVVEPDGTVRAVDGEGRAAVP